MFCIKCGAKIDENTNACANCGNFPTESMNTLPTNNKKKLKPAIIILGVALFTLLVGIGALFFLSNGDEGGNNYYTQANIDIDDFEELPTEMTGININPYDPLTRAQFAMLIIMAFGEELTDAAPTFIDVPLDSYSNVYVTAAIQRGIILPSEHGENLGANYPITREEAARWIVRALGFDMSYSENLSFMDGFSDLQGAIFIADVSKYITQIQNTVFNNSQGNEETLFHYVLRSDVTAINQPPTYNVTETTNTFIVRIPSASTEVRELSVGEMFVLKPTSANPEGLAGRVINITDESGTITITAAIPESLEEIFYEFEYEGEIDLLAEAVEIILAEELIGVDGVEISRNHTSFVSANLTNLNVSGITLNGQIRLYMPRVNASLSLTGVNHLIATTAVQMNITASSQVGTDKVINLFTIPAPLPFGVRVDVPVGIRITSDGQYFLEFDGRADAQFGIRNNRASAQVNLRYDFNFDGNARVAISANIQARARVFFVPIYGIQGDFGRGIQTDSIMQQRCPAGSCFVVGLFHVRRISSLNWGALGWIPLLQFSIDLSDGAITDFRYLRGGSWHRVCPCRVESDVLLPEDVAIISPSERDPVSLAHLGTPVTLEQAQRTPGLYVRYGDRFILINFQFSIEGREVFGNTSAISGLFPIESEMMAILFAPNFEIPRIPNDAQLVLIGINNIGIYEAFDYGWTIPFGVSLADPTFGTGTASVLLNYGRDMWGTINRSFETINGSNPQNYQYRMLYTRRHFVLMRHQGIFTASRNEQFTFAWWEGTSQIQRTYSADRRFVMLPSRGTDGDFGIRANYEIVRTPNGYFEINFFTPPAGYYGIGSSMRFLNRVVYFGEDIHALPQHERIQDTIGTVADPVDDLYEQNIVSPAVPLESILNPQISPYGRQVAIEFLSGMETLFTERGWRDTTTGNLYVVNRDWQIMTLEEFIDIAGVYNAPTVFRGGIRQYFDYGGFFLSFTRYFYDRAGNHITDAPFIIGNSLAEFSFRLYDLNGDGIPEIVVSFINMQTTEWGYSPGNAIFKYVNGQYQNIGFFLFPRFYIDTQGQVLMKVAQAGMGGHEDGLHRIIWDETGMRLDTIIGLDYAWRFINFVTNEPVESFNVDTDLNSLIGIPNLPLTPIHPLTELKEEIIFTIEQQRR